MAEQQVVLMTRAGPAIRTIKIFLIVSIFLLALQVYLNPPEQRGQVACYAPYKLATLVGVDGFKLVAPREHQAHLDTILFIEKMYYQCADGISKWMPGFKPRKNGL
jgi:hypothetical protein